MCGWSDIPNNAAYIDVCKKAIDDASLFSTFRRNPAYTTILEHVTEEQGLLYLCRLSDRALANLYMAAKNDLVGCPVTMSAYQSRISPTTLRYLKVADEIAYLFGSLDGFEVAEIGVGYGGQCRILNLFGNLYSYTLLDIPVVTDLAEKYLTHFNGLCRLWKCDLWWAHYDLIISNYAFSELDRVTQMLYLSILQRSKRGYITYNKVSPYESLSVEEICDAVGGHVIPESPLTHQGNCIIVWGTK